MDRFGQQIRTIAGWVVQCEHLVALTGAGISTYSGIPDFRGPEGVWTRRDAGLPAPRWRVPPGQVGPNASHLSLVELQRLGKLRFLITQNTDNLHRRSGIRPELLVELHGNGQATPKIVHLGNVSSCSSRLGWHVVKGLSRLREAGERSRYMSDENKALARHWFEELFNAQNLDVADEIVAQDHVAHDPLLTDLPTGPEADKHIVTLYHGAFPDAQITVEDQIVEGDRVVTRWTGRGTHQGEFMGVPPSDNRVELMGITINRVSGGKIAETWSVYDALGMMQQIGAIPSPESGQG